jgi:hypothetical protein
VQCAKQPLGSQICGFYTCEYLRACKTYNSSWWQLKKGLEWWHKEQTNQHNFKQTRADICKFVLDKCVLQGEPFFDSNSPLGEEPNCKYEKLRNWPRMLRLEDYAYDMFFLMGN